MTPTPTPAAQAGRIVSRAINAVVSEPFVLHLAEDELRQWCVALQAAIAEALRDPRAELEALKDALLTIASGVLPDGDHVNMPTVMYAEEVLAIGDGTSVHTIRDQVIAQLESAVLQQHLATAVAEAVQIEQKKLIALSLTWQETTKQFVVERDRAVAEARRECAQALFLAHFDWINLKESDEQYAGRVQGLVREWNRIEAGAAPAQAGVRMLPNGLGVALPVLTEDDLDEIESMTLAMAQSTMDKARRQAGLTAATLARIVALPRSNISRIFSGSHNLTLRTMARIVAVCGYELRFQLAAQMRATAPGRRK